MQDQAGAHLLQTYLPLGSIGHRWNIFLPTQQENISSGKLLQKGGALDSRKHICGHYFITVLCRPYKAMASAADVERLLHGAMCGNAYKAFGLHYSLSHEQLQCECRIFKIMYHEDLGG